VQSPLVEHEVQRPLLHVCPPAQSDPDWHVPHCPFTHPWPLWQLEAVLHVQLPPVHVPPLPHCESPVHAAQTLPMHAWPEVQSLFVLQAVVQVPIPQACPVAQSLFWVQEQ
jgi:hypothetical protein